MSSATLFRLSGLALLLVAPIVKGVNHVLQRSIHDLAHACRADEC
jgi:hypothetical protein